MASFRLLKNDCILLLWLPFSKDVHIPKCKVDSHLLRRCLLHQIPCIAAVKLCTEISSERAKVLADAHEEEMRVRARSCACYIYNRKWMPSTPFTNTPHPSCCLLLMFFSSSSSSSIILLLLLPPSSPEYVIHCLHHRCFSRRRQRHSRWCSHHCWWAMVVQSQ